SWGPQAKGDHGAPVSLSKLKKAYEKGIRGISWGPLLTPGPRAVPEFPKWSVRPWAGCNSCQEGTGSCVSMDSYSLDPERICTDALRGHGIAKEAPGGRKSRQ
ncbi:unnamed protein product, partial [Staurois parvus]